jgi:GDPmannose 4,6-dehydratase
MYSMLQLDQRDDIVIATGQSHTVRDFLTRASQVVELNCSNILKITQGHFRPREIVPLCRHVTKARQLLDWRAAKLLTEMIKEMMLNHIAMLQEAK